MHDIIDRIGICDKCGPYHGKLIVDNPPWSPGYCGWCWYHGNPVTPSENFGLKLADKGVDLPPNLMDFSLSSFEIRSPKDSLMDLTGKQKKQLEDKLFNALFYHGYVYIKGEDRFTITFARLKKFETLEVQLTAIGTVLNEVLAKFGIIKEETQKSAN